MIFYSSIFFFLLIFSGLELFNKLNLSQRWKVFNIIIILFFVLSFVRYNTGTDYRSYVFIFDNIDTLNDFSSRFEPLFLFFTKMFKSIYPDFILYIFFSSLIMYGFLYFAFYYFLKRYAFNNFYPLTFLLIFWSIYLGNVFFVRSSVALAILIYSFKVLREQNFTIFLIFVFTILYNQKCIIIVFPQR